MYNIKFFSFFKLFILNIEILLNICFNYRKAHYNYARHILYIISSLLIVNKKIQ